MNRLAFEYQLTTENIITYSQSIDAPLQKAGGRLIAPPTMPIAHLKAKYARRNEPFSAYWDVGDSYDVARFVHLLLEQPDEDLTGEIFGINGSMATQWQKPIRIRSENDPASFFNPWKGRHGSL